MNAIEIKDLSRSFHGQYAVSGLTMTVPAGAVYCLLGEDGSGKSTTEKLICGHLIPDRGQIRLFGKKNTNAGVRARVGALIEDAGCFPNFSVWDNLLMQAIHLGLPNRNDAIEHVLRIVRMEDSAKLRFRKCSPGMKQRTGIAMALLGSPALLILDEPAGGTEADDMPPMREILADILAEITQDNSITVLISSHIPGEFEKIATHYGVIRGGKMIREMTAAEFEGRPRVFVSLKTQDMQGAEEALRQCFGMVRREGEFLRVYDVNDPGAIVDYLIRRGHVVSEMKKNPIDLEEYYRDLTGRKEAV